VNIADAESDLAQLCARWPLASHWSVPEIFAEKTELPGLSLYAVGLVSSAAGVGEIAGSAAARTSLPLRRAYFELWERAALVDAASQAAEYVLLDAAGVAQGTISSTVVFPSGGDGFAFSRSNGVAAGDDFTSAAKAARRELVERHRVLCAWFGLAEPHQLEVDVSFALGSEDDAVARLEQLFDWQVIEFVEPNPPLSSSPLVVVGAFAFPARKEDPFVCGFGCADQRHQAVPKALDEALQRLAFLWGEEIPDRQPPAEQTPHYHQEFYLWPPSHELLHQFLSGRHVGRARLVEPGVAVGSEDSARYIDLTPKHVVDGARVVRAIPQAELALTFGVSHPRIEMTQGSFGPPPIA